MGVIFGNIEGEIIGLTKARAASGTFSTLEDELRPKRVINEIVVKTEEGEKALTGPLVTFPASDPFLIIGSRLKITLFKPAPQGVFFDGPRPLASVLSVKSQGKTYSDKAAIMAALGRIRKSIAMDVANKWFIGAMILAFAVFFYDFYGVLSGQSETLNPELALWGAIAPFMLGRTLWFRRRLTQLDKIATALKGINNR